MSESGEFPKSTDDDDELVHVYIQDNDDELVHEYIKTKLDEVGIKLNEIDKDGTDDTVEIVTTDKEVPEATKSDIRLYAADKGRTIEFQTAPSGR